MLRKIIAIVLIVLPLAAASDELRQVAVTYHMDVEVVGAAYPHVVWMGRGPLRYRWEKGEGRIVAGDVPQMTQRCPVEIPGYKNLMMVLHGQAGAVGVVKVKDGEVTVSEMVFELEVVESIPAIGVFALPTDSSRSLVHLTFLDVTMTSGKIMINGQPLQGKVDIDAMSAELVFATTIPKTGNPDLDDAIAGKTVSGRFHIALQNPYQKN